MAGIMKIEHLHPKFNLKFSSDTYLSRNVLSVNILDILF